MARVALPILLSRALLVASAAVLVSCGLIAGIEEFSRPPPSGSLNGDESSLLPDGARTDGTITLPDGNVVPECTGPGCPPLVVAQTSNGPRDVAICSGRVYWADWGADAGPEAGTGAFRSCELGKVCGAPGSETHAQNLAGGMLVSGGCNDLYFAESIGGKLYRMTRDDAGMLTQTLMADDSLQGVPIGSAAVLGNELVWTILGTPSADQLRRCQVSNCDPTKGTFANQRDTLGPLRAADEAKTDPNHTKIDPRAIWAEASSGGRLLECRPSYCGPGNASPIDQGEIIDIVLSSTGDTLYYLTAAGTILSVVRTAPNTATTHTSGLDRPTRFAFDETAREFFVTSNAAGTIVRVPLGSNNRTTMYQGLAGPYGIAYDSDVIYWTDSIAGTVNRARVR
jgi:hypothetical protein